MVKNMRDSNFISYGLELLKERFVLIDVETGRYEFLYAHPENGRVKKEGPYIEFVSYFLDVVEKKSDKDMLAKLMPLDVLTKQLILNNKNISIKKLR